MTKINNIIAERLKKKEESQDKMSALADRSALGQLTSFAGVFGIADLSAAEKSELEEILRRYAPDDATAPDADLRVLVALTSEVKAISNQATFLHGERIRKAQQLLTRYRDGAFTAWLIATYGNRQTPYNFLQYYEFCDAMPKTLRPLIDRMPRQAIYTLASRSGEIEKKKEIVQSYQGETKEELLSTIRHHFPLDQEDGRREDLGARAIASLQKLQALLRQRTPHLTTTQKKRLAELLDNLRAFTEDN